MAEKVDFKSMAEAIRDPGELPVVMCLLSSMLCGLQPLYTHLYVFEELRTSQIRTSIDRVHFTFECSEVLLVITPL